MKYPDIDPIALSIFGQINIHWYALTYLVAFFLCWRIMKATRGTGDRAWSDQQISDLLSAGMVGVILGGRIGYVLFYGFDAFISNPLVLFRIWEGGMSFHGGLLGVIVALWVYANRTERGFFAVTDFVVLGVPLGLACGRIGNFINAELPGRVPMCLGRWSILAMLLPVTLQVSIKWWPRALCFYCLFGGSVEAPIEPASCPAHFCSDTAH